MYELYRKFHLLDHYYTGKWLKIFTSHSKIMADFGDVETFDSPVEFLNHFLGNGVKSLAQCKALQQTLVAEQDKLKDKVIII